MIALIVGSDVPNVRSVEIAALVAKLDPEVRDAIGDVDRTLIVLALQQPPWGRLRSAFRMTQLWSGAEMASPPKATDLPALLAKLCDAGITGPDSDDGDRMAERI